MSLFYDMMETQKKLAASFDSRATSDDLQQSCEYIKDMVLATTDELHELLAETGWKPWSTSWHVNVEAARGEWIDAWHFMMNLANKLGMTEEMIADMYERKAEINRQRIKDGYDGLNKCPGCGRAMDDPAVRCYRYSDASGAWCSTLGGKVIKAQP